MNVKDRIVFLTGASSGIGLGTAKVFAKAGAKLALCARSKDKLEALKKEILAQGGTAELFPADVTDDASVDAAIAAAAECFGGIDIVIHCAGTNVKGRAEDMKDADWETVIDTNLKSVYRIARAAHPYLSASAQRRPAKFLAIGSVGTFLGIPLSAAYCASKGGLVQYLKVLAVEWARENICVNAVCPGYISTPLSEKALCIGDTRKRVTDRIPLGHIGVPEDIGNALLFLASDAADYITGATLNVDGGLMSAAYTMD